MDIGIFSYNADYGMAPAALAKACEERGFESFWVGEHTHIPAGRRSPFPGGGDLPKPYYHMSDPFVSLATAAAVTTKLKLGTGVCLVVQHDPIALAKTVSTLDRLSDGRVLFGIGGGWNADEMENHGYPFNRRWKLLRERIEAMKAIWTEEQASYDGEFVRFEDIISHPKPAQSPHPPVLMGGATERSLTRVVRYCDGWMPIDVLIKDPAPYVEKLRQLMEAAGRDPAELSLSIFCQLRTDADKLERYRAAGFSRAIMAVPTGDADRVLPRLDAYAELI